MSKTARILTTQVVFFVILFFGSTVKVHAQCQTSAGGPLLVACPTGDIDCSNAKTAGPGGVGQIPACALGTVCNPTTKFCINGFGSSRISGNAIAGGYSLTGAGLGLLINNVVLAIGAVSGLIFFAMLIMGGISYMSSQGDEKQVMHAKNQITAGLIGLLIVFMSWWVVKIISVVFGFNLLSPSFTGP